MNIYMEPTQTEENIKAIDRAIERKESEVEAADRKLNDLRAELRGLKAAREAIAPKS